MPPAPVITLGVSTARPLPEHGEEKVTVCPLVTGAPLLFTVTATLVVPKAESGLVPIVKLLMVTLAAPMAKPSDPLTPAPATWLCALRVVAPADERLAALSRTVAV